jgi:hypothetical protein
MIQESSILSRHFLSEDCCESMNHMVDLKGRSQADQLIAVVRSAQHQGMRSCCAIEVAPSRRIVFPSPIWN